MPKEQEKLRESLIEEAAVALLESDDYYQAHATPLASARELKRKHLEEIKKKLKKEDVREAVNRGLADVRQEIPHLLSGKELAEFQQEIGKINEASLTKLPEAFKKALHEKREFNVQRFFGLKNETLRSIYAVGFHFMEKKEFNKAEDVFSLLLIMNPHIADFWNALGLCQQHLNEFQKAIESFKIVSEIDHDAVGPKISLAECYLNLNEKAEAKREIDAALKLISADPALEKKWGNYLKTLKAK